MRKHVSTPEERIHAFLQASGRGEEIAYADYGKVELRYSDIAAILDELAVIRAKLARVERFRDEKNSFPNNVSISSGSTWTVQLQWALDGTHGFGGAP